jgi:hypothetical protein
MSGVTAEKTAVKQMNPFALSFNSIHEKLFSANSNSSDESQKRKEAKIGKAVDFFLQAKVFKLVYRNEQNYKLSKVFEFI